MVTYYNYYGITKDSESYEIIADIIGDSLKDVFEVEDLKQADLAFEAKEYLESIGLSAEEIEQLKQNLSIDHQ